MSRRQRRGIVGIEAAIVMIAFVIVAAALAFVALNMGMSATQKTKEAIGASMGEAGSALMVDGEVMGYYNNTAGGVTHVAIPIRPSSGKYPVDLSPDRVAISLSVGGNFYADTYEGSTSCIHSTDIAGNLPSTAATSYVLIITGDSDCVLEYGEKAVVVVNLGTTLHQYDSFQVEVKPPEGSPLLVERTIPASLPSGANAFFSLG